MLKFENTAKVGDIVKSFDFKPMTGRPDMFMTGVVTKKGPIYVDRDFGDGVARNVYLCDGYTVKVVGGDSDSRERVGEVGYIPFEVDIMEYDERVTVVATAEEVQLVLENA